MNRQMELVDKDQFKVFGKVKNAWNKKLQQGDNPYSTDNYSS